MGADQDILKFWFVEAGPSRWYTKSDAFDAKIRDRFETRAIGLARQCAKLPHAWEAKPDSSLALIIALDQFPRNMYRDTPAAFAWDALARQVTKRMIDKGWDIKIRQNRRAFIYLPFMHSETMEDQNYCVDLMDSRIDDPSNLRHAKSHRDLILQFGRFPHRNQILGRQSTDAEINFLAAGGYAP